MEHIKVQNDEPYKRLNIDIFCFICFQTMATSTPIPSLVMCYENGNLCSIVEIRTEKVPLTFLTQTWLRNGYKITYDNYVENEKEIQEFNKMFAIFRIIPRNSTENSFRDIQPESLKTDQSKNYSLNPSLNIGQTLSTNSDIQDVDLRVEVTVHSDTRIQENREDDIAEDVELCKGSTNKISENIIVWNTKLRPGHELIMNFNH